MTDGRHATKALVAAAVLGLLAGATACGSARSTAGIPPASPQAATDASDKSACGNHPGSACGAVSPPAPSPPKS